MAKEKKTKTRHLPRAARLGAIAGGKAGDDPAGSMAAPACIVSGGHLKDDNEEKTKRNPGDEHADIRKGA